MNVTCTRHNENHPATTSPVSRTKQKRDSSTKDSLSVVAAPETMDSNPSPITQVKVMKTAGAHQSFDEPMAGY